MTLHALRCLLLLACLAPLASRAQSVLLPVTERVAPSFVEVRCLGLRVYDLDLRAVVRRFPSLGCIDSVAVAEPRTAFLVTRTPDRAQAALLLFDFDTGATLARYDLGASAPGEWPSVRALGPREALVSIERWSDADGYATRLLRLGVEGDAIVLRAARDRPGVLSPGDRGTELALWNGPGTGRVRVERLRVDDLASLGTLYVDVAPDEFTTGVLSLGDRVYVWSRSAVRVVDAESGAPLAHTAFDVAIRAFPFIDATRFMALRVVATSEQGDFRSELVAVDLPELGETTIATTPGAAHDGPLDGHGVLVEQPDAYCFPTVCSDNSPLDFYFARQGAIVQLTEDAVAAEPRSVQFVAPPLPPDPEAPAGVAAAPIPTLDGGALSFLAALLLAGAACHRRARRHPA